MGRIIRNLYKKADIFFCRHPSHKQFNYSVSPYHIYKVTGCRPSGCVEFIWRCRQFDKGSKCPKKYKHVGRGCSSCKYYYEIKKCRMPETKLGENQLVEFYKDLREFEGWLEGMNNSSVRFSGVIDSIRPHLSMKIGRRGNGVRMDNYFASFAGGYFGNDRFEDRIYLKVSDRFLKRTRIAPGDELECDIIFTVNKGRVILRDPRRIDIARNGGKRIITQSNALVGRATGKIINGPVHFCRDCHYCCLVDIDDFSRTKPSFYRRYYCLRGITDPEYCPVRLRLLKPDNTQTIKSNRF